MASMTSLNQSAASATLHCLTGCAVGEILGMIISTALGWAALASIALAVTLAFIFGYAFSMFPLIKSGLGIAVALKIALAADTLSILTMEITDNLFILAVPNAIHSELTFWLFWVSLILSLFVAFWVAFPVNRYLISRGKGHALAHKYHNHDHHD